MEAWLQTREGKVCQKRKCYMLLRIVLDSSVGLSASIFYIKNF